MKKNPSCGLRAAGVILCYANSYFSYGGKVCPDLIADFFIITSEQVGNKRKRNLLQPIINQAIVKKQNVCYYVYVAESYVYK